MRVSMFAEDVTETDDDNVHDLMRFVATVHRAGLRLRSVSLEREVANVRVRYEAQLQEDGQNSRGSSLGEAG